RASDKDGLFRVLGIDAVPALRNLQLRGFEERCKIVEDKRIYTRLVERRDIESVFVRIAERNLASTVLRYQDVNAVLYILRHLGGKPRAHRRQALAGLVVGVVAQSQTGSERWANLPGISVGRGTHHLQLAARQATVGEDLGIERLEIVAGADDGVLRLPLLAACLDGRQRDVLYRRVEAQRYAVLPFQPAGQ